MQALWDRKGETQGKGKTDNLQNKGKSIIMSARNIKANLFKSKSKFMALLKPTEATEVAACWGENISFTQRNLISLPVPTIWGCPSRGDIHASAVPLASSLPAILSWERECLGPTIKRAGLSSLSTLVGCFWPTSRQPWLSPATGCRACSPGQCW